MNLVQKFIVEDVSKASSIMPAHIALVNPNGSPALKARYVDPETGTIKDIVDALVAAGLMLPSSDGQEPIQEDSISSENENSDDADKADDQADTEPSEGVAIGDKNTVAEINAYAAEHGIDLGKAKTKSEKLAIINGLE